MSPSISAFGLMLLFIVVVLLTVIRFQNLRAAFYFGVSLWGRWLPVIAIGVYISIIALAIGKTQNFTLFSLSAVRSFAPLELTIFFMTSVLFLTKFNSLTASLVLVYIIQKIVFGSLTLAEGMPAEGIPVDLMFLLASTTIIAVVGDKLPWLMRSHNAAIREVTLVVLSFISIFSVFLTILKIHQFNDWFQNVFAVNMPGLIVLLALAGLLIGWLTIAIGVTRHVTLPILSIPTLAAMFFVSSLNPVLLTVPFAACCALALAFADRRANFVKYTMIV